MTKHCPKCLDYLVTQLELDTDLCEDCYDGPHYFTFFDWEIKEFEFFDWDDQEHLKSLKIACEKKNKKKEQVLTPISIDEVRKECAEEISKENFRYDKLRITIPEVRTECAEEISK